MSYEKHLETAERLVSIIRRLITLSNDPHAATAGVMMEAMETGWDLNEATNELFALVYPDMDIFNVPKFRGENIIWIHPYLEMARQRLSDAFILHQHEPTPAHHAAWMDSIKLVQRWEYLRYPEFCVNPDTGEYDEPEAYDPEDYDSE